MKTILTFNTPGDYFGRNLLCAQYSRNHHLNDESKNNGGNLVSWLKRFDFLY